MILLDSMRNITHSQNFDKDSLAQPPLQTDNEEVFPGIKWYKHIFAGAAVMFILGALSFVFLFGSKQRMDELNEKLTRGRSRRQW